MDINPGKVLDFMRNKVADLTLDNAMLQAAVSQCEERIATLEAELLAYNTAETSAKESAKKPSSPASPNPKAS